MNEQNLEANFHLSPALAVSGIIDYSMPEGWKYYEKSIEKLNEELFDCETDDLHLFIDALKERAREMGWDIHGIGITDILLDPLNPDSGFINIFTRHGELTLEHIRAFEATYIDRNLRATQDAYAMYCCIMNSITKSAIKRVTMWKDEYTVNDHVSGNLLFKILVRESGLDTKTTAMYIRNSLGDLATYMNEVGDDILKFNTYVKGLVRSLHEHGEYSSDLLINVTKGYLACKDKQFKRYISTIIERDEDDPLSILTVDQLMVKAANKYKSSVQNGTWKAPDDVDRELMALRAEVNRSKNGKRTNQKKGWTRKESTPASGKPTYFISPDKWAKRPKWLKTHQHPCHFDRLQVYEGVTFTIAAKIRKDIVMGIG